MSTPYMTDELIAELDALRETVFSIGEQRDELRAKLEALDTDLAKTLVALDNEVARSTIQKLRAEKAEAKLDASERACAEMRECLDWIAAYSCNGGEAMRRMRIALSSGAGRDYVPKADLEEAQRVLRYCEEKLMRKGDHSLPEAVDRWLMSYVPKSEVDAAWRKGMTDAAWLCASTGTPSGKTYDAAIIHARDAKKESEK